MSNAMNDGIRAGMAIEAAIAQAAAQLERSGVAFGHGTDNAWDEAAWLTLWSLGLALDTDLASLAPQTLDSAQAQALQALLQRRISERKPAAYLTREAWLHGVPFYVDERSIVPRSLIAAPLLEGRLDAWLPEQGGQVLDLCTGNGSLAVLAALAWPQAQIDAVDISADALAVAAINCERHGLQTRIRLIESDGLQALQPAQPRYDLVLCNPPYVNSRSMAALPGEYRAEPALALAGGEDGMDFISPMLQALPEHMNDGAALVLEIGHERAHFERAFGTLQAVWLSEPEDGGDVLLLEKAELLRWRAAQGRSPGA